MEDKNIAENLNLDISNFIKLSENFFPKYDDGEVYLEYNNSEIITFDNGKVISANQDIDSGFGIRIVDYDKSGYAYKSGFSNLEYSRLLHMFEFAESGCSNSQKNLQKRTPIKILYTIYMRM